MNFRGIECILEKLNRIYHLYGPKREAPFKEMVQLKRSAINDGACPYRLGHAWLFQLGASKSNTRSEPAIELN